MEKIGVSIWTGMGERNLIQSGVIKSLQDEYELLYMSTIPHEYKDLFKKSCSFSASKIDKVLHEIYTPTSYYALWNKSKNSTLEKYIRRDQDKSFLKYKLKQFSALAYLRLIKDKKNYDFFRDLCLLKNNFFLKDLDAILTTSIDCLEDQMLMYSSIRRGLPCVSLVHSWDNLPSRGLLPARPDKLLVWNQVMFDQAIRLHNISPDKCDIVGAPQYYLYRKMEEELSKDDLRNQFNIQGKQKIVTYTCTNKVFFPDEIAFLKRLCAFIDSVSNLIIVIRLHPGLSSSDYIDNFVMYKNVRFDVPDWGFFAKKTNFIGSIEKTREFICLMKHSDVVINLASTTTLDAMIFDTPVICIKFNSSISEKSWCAAEKWYQSEHFKTIDALNSYDSVYSFDNFINSLIDVLDSPEKRKIERLNTVNLLAPKLDTALLINRSLKGALR